MKQRVQQLEKKLNSSLYVKQNTNNLSFNSSRRAFSPDLIRDNIELKNPGTIKLIKKLGGSVLG